MRKLNLLVIALFLLLLPLNNLSAEDANHALKRIGAEVAKLNLGFGEYVLGRHLTDQQKQFAKDNLEKKSVKGSYKFYDKGTFVVASQKSDMVIGIYQENDQASKDELREAVGALMMKFEEPTAMAHDKMIYWVFNKDGRISQALFDMERDSGGSDVLATVKFASSLEIRPNEDPKVKEKDEKKEEETAKIYTMITSDKLSKIFLALNK